MTLLLTIALLLASNDPHYLIYLHGEIVEGSDGRPVHPEYGVYDHAAIVDSLAAVGFTVLSEIRPAATDGFAYADRVVAQVDSLRDLGIPPSRISVVGMSKGGGIAVAVASRLADPGLNFVFLATCVEWIDAMPRLTLPGRVLSLYEESDAVAGSCRTAFAGSEIGPPFREIRLSTGLGHGAFYRPDPAWIDPVAAWCHDRDPGRRLEADRMYARYREEFASVPGATADSLARWLASGEAILVDVRDTGERAVSMIPGALTRRQFEDVDPRGRRVVAYCTIGYRSGLWARRLRERGIDAWNLEAGIIGWVHAWYPVEHEGRQVRAVHVYGDEWNLLPSWYAPVW